jgi:hypothetical protein
MLSWPAQEAKEGSKRGRQDEVAGGPDQGDGGVARVDDRDDEYAVLDRPRSRTVRQYTGCSVTYVRHNTPDAASPMLDI